MSRFHLVLLAPALFLTSAATSVSGPVDPLHFFEGRTETQGLVKVLFHKDYLSRSVGQGRIEPDGSLILVQRVFDDGKLPHDRRWRVRQVGPGHYAGTMSEAVGPVTIDKVGELYRFRFKMTGRLNVEQVLTPLAGGRSASTSTKVRRFGFVVATTEGVVRKVAAN
jgi:hypothetical protein